MNCHGRASCVPAYARICSMKRLSAMGGRLSGFPVDRPATTSPLDFPSADGPARPAPAAGAAAAAPAVDGRAAWAIGPAVIGSMCAVALVAIVLNETILWPRLERAVAVEPSAVPALAPLRREAAWLELALLGATAAGAWLLSRRLARPVRAVSLRAGELALRYTGRALQADRNEMRSLNTAFTAMTAAMLAQFERLRGLHLDELQNSLELQRRYALMRLLRDLSAAAQESPSLLLTLERALEDIGGYLDWPIGRVLIAEGARDDDAARLRSLWFAPDSGRYAGFIEACDLLPMDPTTHGLIGRARVTGMPHWVTDLSRLEDWRRHELAERAGLKSAFVIPVSFAGRGSAYIEFFAGHRVEASAEMLELIEAIHAELWQAGERHGGDGIGPDPAGAARPAGTTDAEAAESMAASG